MNREDIFEIVTRHIGDIIPKLRTHAFQRDDRLKELGVNSVDRAELVIMAMESLSLRIPLVEVSGSKSIGELADMLFEKLGSGGE